jgi:hypothetical protein
VPKGRWHTVTMLATLTPDGMGPTMVIEGAVDREAFDALSPNNWSRACVPAKP